MIYKQLKSPRDWLPVCASVRSMRQASAAVCSCFALCWSCKPWAHRPLQPLILLNPWEARWLPFRIMLPKIEGLPLRSDKVYHWLFLFFFFLYSYCLKETAVLWLWVCSFALCIWLCFVLIPASVTCHALCFDSSFQVRCKDLSKPQKKDRVSKVTDTHFFVSLLLYEHFLSFFFSSLPIFFYKYGFGTCQSFH